ncbi:phosphatidylserine/phosphatidylglycerophosphate/cardiolipin synthase family protein [Falsirhodobacter sp. alg1]|uniref:phospholipase D-like domain-containing protein n=1 Tax=Falsirhodobacter sp. alg1 TaxID=1472418 RepID=UPI000786855B|nr:phospholipase D family protein [Falsirhodobacter sp. alg1]
MMMDGLTLLLWTFGTVVVVAAASMLTYRSYRRWARRVRGPVQKALLRSGPPTALDGLVPDGDAARLLTLQDGRHAFAARLETARLAGRSLDLMYYLWYSDLTGWLLMAELVRAADRGVRVRLLLDDVNVQGLDRTFLALNQHPNIDIRLFNPVRSRSHALRRIAETLLGLARFNRRMHGKMWIADGAMAIIGGRNIGDTYFNAMEAGGTRSHDLDMAVTGPPVAEAETVFDAFWNLGLSLPIVTLWPKLRVSDENFRRRLRRRASNGAARKYCRKMPRKVLSAPFAKGEVALVADPPHKVYGHDPEAWLIHRLPTFLNSARRQVRIVTPYFVPGQEGLRVLTDLARSGVQVQVVTNALCSTDNLIVYGAYARYRRALLRAGVELFEYGPAPDAGRRVLLHEKLFLVDGERALVGSVNYDLRSAFMNTELALYIDASDTVAELMADFDTLISPVAAFRLVPQGRKHVFEVQRDGMPAVIAADPYAGKMRRLRSWIVGHLPIQSYL